jgi:hypothetical protein
MTKDRTLKQIINDQRSFIGLLKTQVEENKAVKEAYRALYDLHQEVCKQLEESGAKIEAANKILEPKIDDQQHLINSGSNMAVYALYFSKQELIDLKASLSQEQKPKEIDDEGWDHTNEPKWSTVANGELKREG